MNDEIQRAYNSIEEEKGKPKTKEEWLKCLGCGSTTFHISTDRVVYCKVCSRRFGTLTWP